MNRYSRGSGLFVSLNSEIDSCIYFTSLRLVFLYSVCPSIFHNFLLVLTTGFYSSLLQFRSELKSKNVCQKNYFLQIMFYIHTKLFWKGSLIKGIFYIGSNQNILIESFSESNPRMSYYITIYQNLYKKSLELKYVFPML